MLMPRTEPAIKPLRVPWLLVQSGPGYRKGRNQGTCNAVVDSWLRVSQLRSSIL